jgi:hypothetical protein
LQSCVPYILLAQVDGTRILLPALHEKAEMALVS